MSAKATEQKDGQFPGQHEGEEVRLLFRQHPLVMRKALIVGLLVMVVAVLPLDFYGLWYTNTALYHFFIKVALIGPGLVLVAWVYRWIGWYYTVFIVTSQRLIAITQQGLFDRTVDEWQLQDITNLNYHIGGFQAVLFGYGTITARTYIGDLEMKTIHRPAEVHGQLMAVVREAGGASGSTRRLN